jgi:hypothetical protein
MEKGGMEIGASQSLQSNHEVIRDWSHFAIPVRTSKLNIILLVMHLEGQGKQAERRLTTLVFAHCCADPQLFSRVA